MMADDSELEKRAIEELLRETTRARVRAETMGPAGWMKCPLHATNKRFLLNTLRPTGLQRQHNGPTAGQPTTRGCSTSESPSEDSSHSRSPRDNGGHRDQKTHRSNGNHKDKQCDGEGRYCHNDGAKRNQRHEKGSLNKVTETDRFPPGALSPGEAIKSGESRGRLYSCNSSSHNRSPYAEHGPDSGCQRNKAPSRSRSPVRGAYGGRSHK